MISDNLEIKQKFVEMCRFIYELDGEVYFPFDTVIHSNEWVPFKAHPDYAILKEKMANLLTLVNEDRSMAELDIEDELWDMI
jgi:hypothetical protein